MMRRSYIFDIGLDHGRDNNVGRSPAYRMERQLIDLAEYRFYRQRQYDDNRDWNYLQP